MNWDSGPIGRGTARWRSGGADLCSHPRTTLWISFHLPLRASSDRQQGGAGAGAAAVGAPVRGTRSWAVMKRGDLAQYLVVHTPRERELESVRPPTRLRALAEASTILDRSPRWLKAWSPDARHRIFTLWDAENADEVLSALEEFGFLDDMDAAPLRVREWGPGDVLPAER